MIDQSSKTPFTSNNDIYRILLNTISEALVVVNRQGSICYFNKRLLDLFGYEKDELIDQPIELLIPNALRKAHKNHRKKYAAHPVQRTMGLGMNLEGLKKNKDSFPVEVSLNHFSESNQQYVLALITDISKRKYIEDEIRNLNLTLEKKVEERTKQLSESQLLYKAIARNFPKGTINVFDKNFNYVFVEGKELFKIGVTSENLIGTSYLSRLSPVLSSKLEKLLKSVFLGNTFSHILEFDNNIYELNAVPLINQENKVDQILVVERNITDERLSKIKLENAYKKEKELGELKSKFVSMASHEFRTPLSTILSSANLALKHYERNNSEKVEKHISRIRSNVHHLTNILNDFLSFDKLEEGYIQVNKTKIELDLFLNEVIDELSEVVKEGQYISFNRNCSQSIIKTDQNILKNILFNLISNAIKYSDKGQEIKIIADCTVSEFVVSVIDKGIGIPKSEQIHIFSQFFRANNAVNIQGTGLGLNIVNQYINILNGNITFTSTENIGTTFTVTIPI